MIDLGFLWGDNCWDDLGMLYDVFGFLLFVLNRLCWKDGRDIVIYLVVTCELFCNFVLGLWWDVVFERNDWWFDEMLFWDFDSECFCMNLCDVL